MKKTITQTKVKNLSLLIVAILINSVIFAQAVGVEFTTNNITYKVTSLTPNEVEVAVNDDAVTGSVVNIPSSVTSPAPDSNNFDVTAIAADAFKFETTITSITVPGSVKTIGQEAFRNTDSLTSITLEEGVESIGVLAFFNAGGGLTSISLPSSITNISDRAFDISDGNPQTLTTIILQANTPPSIGANKPFGSNTLTAGIDLRIPTSATAYTGSPWDDFNGGAGPTQDPTLNISEFYKTDASTIVTSTNPVANAIKLNTNGSYSIVNIGGQKVQSGSFEGEINVESLNTGVYLLAIKDGVYKFVKE